MEKIKEVPLSVNGAPLKVLFCYLNVCVSTFLAVHFWQMQPMNDADLSHHGIRFLH